MNIALFIRISVIVMLFSICLYFYIDKQNQLTKLKMTLPQVENEVAVIEEENKRLQYEIDQFVNPSHLMELSRLSEYSYLKHPFVHEILSVKEGIALNSNKETQDVSRKEKSKIPIAVGAK